MDLSIIIVNYNSRDLLRACVQSIMAGDVVEKIEIVVVDNDSKDGSVALVLEEFPGVRVIENEENIGFAGAVNKGLREAAGNYILVLNPDIEASVDSIDTLRSYMEAHEDVALCAPKLVNPDGTLQYSCRTDYTFAILLYRRTVLGRLFPDHTAIRRHLMMDWDHADAREVDWVLGAAFMMRRGSVAASQGMDERFFLYFEDVDLCMRLRRSGWKVVYVPDAVMVHHHQRASARGMINRAKIEHLKSWLKFEWKHRGEPLVRSVMTRRPAKIG